ncbi:MAG: DUF2384 domain-containing protein [Afipia sp.]|nr:DUF2384 domain-containing protein [Afipia sp.]
MDRFNPVTRRRLSAPGLRTFLKIADLWSLSQQQRRLILGYPSRSTYVRWRTKAQQEKQLTLNVDVLMRVSAMLGIYRALRVLCADEVQATEWLRTPHNAIVFGGLPPLDLITSGTQDGLLTVLRFLNDACSRCYMLPDKAGVDFPGYDEADVVVR